MPQPRAASDPRRFAVTKGMAPRRSISVYRPGDEVSICRLFEVVFGHCKTAEHWRWQFGLSGAHVVVARDAHGAVVGQFACVPRRVQAENRELVFAQSVDSMVHPAYRTGLKQLGLFASIVRYYVAHFGRLEFETLGYGLPNREALRVGRRLLGYTPLLDTWLWVGDVDSVPETRGACEISIGRDPEHDHDQLWRRAQLRFPLVAVRDRRFWEWRFASCPGRPYEFLAVRRDGQLRAAAVYKPSYLVKDCAALVDLLWDGLDAEALAECLGIAERRVRDHGQKHLVTMLREDCAEATALEARGYRRFQSGLPLVARSYHPSVALGWVPDHWWFSLADFDLV